MGDCGSRGTRADQGVRPSVLVQSPVFMPIHAGQEHSSDAAQKNTITSAASMS